MTVPEPDKQFKRGSGVVKVYRQSPFLAQMDTRVRRVTNQTGDMMLISKDRGEVVNDVAGFWQSQEVDSTQFVKLFVQGVKALTDLTSAGTKVFELLYLRVQENPNQDRVNMAFWTIDQQATPISERTHSRGMCELIQKGFIASTPTLGVYWLNPNYLWNGDRLAFVKTYVRKIRPENKHTFVDPGQQVLPFED
jgi:hypothetical protein